MIVLKFGGTSVGDGQRILQVLEIARTRLAEAPLLVSSAMGKTTDLLLDIAARAVSGDLSGARELREQLEQAHQEALDVVLARLDPERQDYYREQQRELFRELAPLVQGLGLIRELSPRTSDALLSFGERLSTAIIRCGAEAMAIPATLLDSRTLIVTGNTFGSAQPDFTATTERIRTEVAPRAGHLLIAQGFIGATPEGITTTLGRGGSDYSATIFGMALAAERVEIWTDVNGIMTADPRIIPEARTIPELTYNEAAELSFFGARVVHPATMIPAVEKGIPVVVCNTFDPTGPATVIRDAVARKGLRAIAARAGVTIITVHSSRMLNAWGFLSRMFRIFDEHRVIVDLIATSEVSVSVSVDMPEPPAVLTAALQQLGSVRVDRNKAVMSLVGEGIWNDTQRIQQTFAALAPTENDASPIEVEMISLGSSDTNLSLVLPQDQMGRAMEQLHHRFFRFSLNGE